MQPCPNCGRTELSPAGNCLNCGLFRGNEGYGQGGYAPGPYQQPGQMTLMDMLRAATAGS